MHIFRPIKSCKISQVFGENKNSLYATFSWKGHNGVDFACANGNPVHWYLNDTNGTVDKILWDGTGGLGVYIITKENGKYYQHRFWHLEKADCFVGKEIKPGMLIAHSDNTGTGTTGPHLHALDIKEVVKDSNGNWQSINKDNGYGGSIDPTAWYTDKFILDELYNEEVLIKQKSIIEKMIKLIQDFLKGR
jgi:murein DD-endopeptidase MepM/ murein hydrolase activator NlpD